MSAVEVGIPLAVLTVPALSLGAGLAYLGGLVLGGDVRMDWTGLAGAAGAVLVLAFLSLAASVQISRSNPTPQILREDAL